MDASLALIWLFLSLFAIQCNPTLLRAMLPCFPSLCRECFKARVTTPIRSLAIDSNTLLLSRAGGGEEAKGRGGKGSGRAEEEG